MDMSADSKLYSMEDSMKDKYTEIIRRMSHVELKQFKKSEYKTMVLDEITKILPDISKQRLDETAQCVSNFLQTEVQEQLRRKSRQSAMYNTDTDLSETVINDLDTTLEPAENVSVPDHVNNGDDDTSDDTSESESEQNTIGDHTSFDDSVTLLKQVATDEPKNTEDSGADKNEHKRSTKSTKCCDTCKVKPTSKRKYSEIRCSLCVQWFHETCVGITDDEPIGIWLCQSCRDIPTSIKQNVSSMKNEINDLKECTKNILKAVQDLSTKVENSFGCVNDRITSLITQINGKDICISESIESLQGTANNIKTSLDRKSCTILNKTTAVLDKIKSKTETTTTTTKTTSNKQSADKNIMTPKNMSASTSETKATRSNTNSAQNKRLKKPKPKRPTQNKNIGKPKASQKGNQYSSQTAQETDDEIDQIDLTTSPKKSINQSTLLIGSSILKRVRTNELNSDTTVRSFPGATTVTLKDKLEHYDIDSCKTVILHIGGNDADNGDDIDTFCDNYIALLESLASDDRRLIVSGLLPRKTVNLEPYNEQLRSLCAENDIEFVENYDNFLPASGEIPASYFWKDKVHLNEHGKRKLLSNINDLCKVTNDQNSSQPRRMFQGSRQGARPPQRRGPHSMSKFCHICQINRHTTQECWYNGRNSGMPGRSSQ